jgi:hypothetical protein
MKVCFSMVIKDESPALIQRCLESVKPWINTWEIVDSTVSEEVQSVVQKTLQGIPGELHACPWISKNYNLNVALQFTRNKSDYLLMLEPSDELIVSPNFLLPTFVEDEYVVQKQVEDGYFIKALIQKIFYKNLPRAKWVTNEEGLVSRLYIAHPTPNVTIKVLANITTRSLQNLGASHEA